MVALVPASAGFASLVGRGLAAALVLAWSLALAVCLASVRPGGGFGLGRKPISLEFAPQPRCVPRLPALQSLNDAYALTDSAINAHQGIPGFLGTRWQLALLGRLGASNVIGNAL